MADKTVTFELLIDASKSSQTVGELKESIKDLQSAALAAGEQGNKSLADQYIKAAGEAKDKINDLNQSIKNAGSDTRKLDGLVQIGSGIASGFAAAQGAAALFGGANKDLEKSLLKVQAATALAVGVQQIANLLQKESKAMMFLSSAATTTYSTVVGVATGKIKIATLAQQAWNAMMALNPIGLVVTAIALMTAAIYQLVTAESEEEKQLKKVNQELEYNNNQRERDISYIKEQQRQQQKLYDNELKLMKIKGASEDEINAKKFDQIDRGLKLNAELILQEKKKIENNEALIAGLPPIAKRTEEQLNLYEKYSSSIEKSNTSIFDLITANDDLNISYQELSNSLNGVTASQEVDAEAKKKQSEYLQKQQEYYSSLANSGAPGSIGYYNFLLGESNSRLEKLVPGSAAYNKELTNQLNLTTQLEAAQANAFLTKQQRKGITNPEVLATDALPQFPTDLQAEVDWEKFKNDLLLQQDADFEATKEQREKEAEAKRKANRKKEWNELLKDKEIRKQIAIDGINILSSIGSLVIKNADKAAKFQKKLAVAQLLVDTASGISSVVKDASKAGFPAAIPIIVGGIAMVLGNMAKAKSILSKAGDVSVPSLDAGAVGAGGGAVPNAPELNQPTTNIPQGQGTTIPETKVYVTETDIKRVGNRVNVIESRATFR